jgi:hypothetical protein
MLLAKKLEAQFIRPDYDYEGEPTEEEISYFVYEFENGLILVPSESSYDYFFPSKDEIDGGSDTFVSTKETGKEVNFSKKELNESWGNSVTEFGIDYSSLPKVRELLFN